MESVDAVIIQKETDGMPMLRFLSGKLSSVRTELMGVSIISVVLYHLYCWVVGVPLLAIFKWGFIGVDVFMFVSAFGLCFSYEKNAILVFYENRLKRIFPLLIVQAGLCATIEYCFDGVGVAGTLKSFGFHATTLNYYSSAWYHYGSWFLPAIVLLYILFPLVFKGMAIVRGGGG